MQISTKQRMVTHCSVLGGRGGGAAPSWISSAENCFGGIGGGGGESSLFSSSLRDSWVSSAENCFGGTGGGGEPSGSSGLWDVVSTLLERVPGGIIIDLSEHTQVY